MRVAKGIAGGKPFAVIDTESRRALHYADAFAFDHAEINAPFRPDTYLDAIESADKAGYPVVLVDSMSHVWAGDGGVIDWQEEELERMAGSDWKRREACKMAAWIKPKIAHKKMVQRLLQLRAHVILCFRAEPKIEMVREEGKTKIVAKSSLTGLDGWIPICEKMLPYELTASFLLMADEPGIPRPIKLSEHLKPFFPLDRPVGESAGEQIAKWARGDAAASAAPAGSQRAIAAPDSALVEMKSAIHEWIEGWTAVGEEKAVEGVATLRVWYNALPSGEAKNKFGREVLPRLKRLAEQSE
jgi:hypothetical protein